MIAIDLDALERLAQRCVAASEKLDAATNAYARWDAEQEALAPHEDLGLHGAEVCALITRLRATESERDDLRCEVEALQAERDTARLEAGRLRARLRAAEARIERVGAILSDEGCDCYCDCDSDGHNADCDLCLACRIDREVSP